MATHLSSADRLDASLRSDLCLSVQRGDRETFKRILSAIVVVDGEEECVRRPLCIALHNARFDMAKQLVERGANPNFRITETQPHIMTTLTHGVRGVECEVRTSVRLLLRHGSHIPRAISPFARSVVEDYVFRNWTRKNHLEWPVPLRKQVVALLSVVRVRGYLFGYLMQFVVAAHFVWET